MAAPPGRHPRTGPAVTAGSRTPGRRRGAVRRTVTGVAAAVGLLPLAACGGVSFADNGAHTFTTMGYGMGDALATTRIDDAQKVLGKDLHIQVNQGAFDEQQFLSAVAAGDPPDIVHMDRALIGGYAARGALVPLTSCIRKAGIDLHDYRASALDEATLDGTVYGLPDSYDNRLLLMDTTALKDAGLKSSDVDTSDWKGLRKLSRAVARTSGNKLTRIGFDPKIPEFFPLWVKANGGSLISADGRTAQLDSPRVVQALEFTTQLIKDQGGWGRFKSLRDSFDQFGRRNQLAQHQVGAYPMEDWYVNVLAENSPKITLSTAFFKDRTGKPLDYASGYSWAIPKGSRHAAEACTFIKTMISTRTWVHAAEAKAKEVRAHGAPYTGDYTGNREADAIIEKKVWKPTGNEQFDTATRRLYQLGDAGFAVPANAAGSEFRAAWQDACNRVLSGAQTPRQALEQAQREAQSALDIANEGRK